MALENDEAVVIQRVDYSETSQILVLFTRRHGKVRLIAKGVKRSTKTRFAAGIDLLEIGHVVFSTGGRRSDALATLTEWKPSTPLGGLRTNLARMYLGQYAAETVAALTEDGDKDERLYEALVEVLQAAAQADDVAPLLYGFQCALLDQVGSRPNVETCVSCGRPASGREPTYFSSLEGGLICRDCEGAYVEKREISADVCAVLQGHRQTPNGILGAATLLNYHISHLMGRPPKLGEKLLEQCEHQSEPRTLDTAEPSPGGPQVRGC